MPWCETCSRFVPSSDVGPDEACATCGQALPPPADYTGAPWHFKLLVVATVAYLAFRAYQGLAWLAGRL